MSDVIISARNVTKTYRLYSKPHHRLFDAMGLLRGGGKYSEHHALYGINLEIQRGEKVALIGRNGAGKSTLLKLITGVTQPSAGELVVHSEASALLQIGTTFHPEFTGRQNVLSYLAHLGIVGSDAEIRLANIIEFAELEEYIDQPVKTYSTGMGARLMFATSTIMQPELLVIDEILSVGDAYFAKKSFERIEELCSNGLTTLVLVSHDIYSASTLCERMIWIDSGQVMIDGASSQVMKAYEDSIRVQEENRLRRSKLLKLETAHRLGEINYPDTLLIEICCSENEPLPRPIAIARIDIVEPNGQVISAPIVSDNPSDNIFKPFLDFAVGVWGDISQRDGRQIRFMKDHGSPFNKIVIGFPGVSQSLLATSILKVEIANEAEVSLLVRAYLGKHSSELGRIVLGVGGEWSTSELSLESIARASSGQSIANEVRISGIHGTGVIRVTAIRLLNKYGAEVDAIQYDEKFSIELSLDIRDPEFEGNPQVLLAFQKDGVLDICRVIERGITLNAKQNRSIVVTAIFPRCQLGNGAYAVSVMIAEQGYYDKPQTVFFAINPSVYVCLSRALEFMVSGGGIVGSGTGFIAEALWSSNAKGVFYESVQEKDRCAENEIINLDYQVADNLISDGNSKILLNYPDEFLTEFPAAAPVALSVVETIWDKVKFNSFEELTKNSPGLVSFDWYSYLRLSAIRLAHAHRALHSLNVRGGKVLDFGSYFGNFSLALRELGYQVDAVDSYKKYSVAFSEVVELFGVSGIQVFDFEDVGYLLEGIRPGTYDAVLLMGVIEHIPHSPKQLLLAVDYVLKPGGVLILDTPNLAYEYNRASLDAGNTIHCPIQKQFDTEIPFEGHHREYITDEIIWMLNRINHKVLSIDHFNYSCYSLKELTGIDFQRYQRMQSDPLRRELILTASRRCKQ